MHFPKRDGSANLKSELDKLDTDRLEKVPSVLSSLKSKVDNFHVDKLKPVATDLRKLSDVLENDVVKKTMYDELITIVNAIGTSELVTKIDYDAKIKDIEDKIPSISNLATNSALNANINEIKDEIPSISDLATTAALTAF